MADARESIVDEQVDTAKYEERPRFRDLAPTAALAGRDYLVALLLAGAVCALQFLWSDPLPRPALWEPLAEAAGLRPLAAVVLGLWRLGASALFSACGAPLACAVLGLLGKAAFGLLAALAYLLVREMLAPVPGLHVLLLGRFLQLDRLVAVLAAAGFACSEPVRRLGQTLGPDGLELLLAVAACWVLVRFVHGGRIWMGRVLWLLLGLLSAEGPLGLALFALAVAMCVWAVRNAWGNTATPLFNPLVLDLSAWHATLLFLVGFGGALALNVVGFVAGDGAVAAGLEPMEVAVRCLRDPVTRAAVAATPLGWALLGGCALLPCVLAVGLAPSNRDEDAVMSYRVGIAFLILLVFGFLPLTPWPCCWYWSLNEGGVVRSPRLLAFAALLSSIGFAHALAVLGTDVFCRNFRRIALTRDPELLSGEGADQMRKLLVAPRRWRLPVLVGVPAVLLSVFASGTRQAVPRALLEVVGAFAYETLRARGTTPCRLASRPGSARSASRRRAPGCWGAPGAFPMRNGRQAARTV